MELLQRIHKQFSRAHYIFKCCQWRWIWVVSGSCRRLRRQLIATATASCSFFTLLNRHLPQLQCSPLFLLEKEKKNRKGNKAKWNHQAKGLVYTTNISWQKNEYKHMTCKRKSIKQSESSETFQELQKKVFFFQFFFFFKENKIVNNIKPSAVLRICKKTVANSN